MARKSILVPVAVLGAVIGIGAGERAEAPPRGPVLVELFTSQGCSSCPAADAFVGELASLGYGPDRVVPLTFHVSYWDDLGWKDPFGQDAFNLRQMAYVNTFAAARAQEENTIRGPYTPQMVVDGRVHFSGAMRKTAVREIEAALARPSPIALEIRATTAAKARTVNVAITARAAKGETFDTDRAKIGIFAALYQKEVVTSVGAGENAGRTLEEYAVVRELAGPRLFRGERAVNETSFELSLPVGVDPSRCGVAVFIQALDSLQVLAAARSEVRTGG